MKLNVGQVIYLLTNKSSKVYPALVCEEIKKKSLDGETTNYVVRLPTDDAREVEVDKLDAEIFETIKDAKETMLSRISSEIDSMLEQAVNMSSVFSKFVIDQPVTIEDQAGEENTESAVEEDFALVDLGDGKVGRVNIGHVNDVIGEGK